MDSSKKISQAAPLYIAVGPKDKENLSIPSVIQKYKKGSSVKSTKSSFMKNNRTKDSKSNDMINKINNITTTRKVTAEDLTSSAKPGEGYWEQLAESRRVALEATMKENMDLHQKIHELEYEVTLVKSMLSEARQTISTLLEMANDENEESYEENEPEAIDNDPDESLDDTSFGSG